MRRRVFHDGASRHSLFQNVGILTLGNIIQMPLNFLVVIYVARVAGPGPFGALNFSTALLAYFSIMGSMGLPTYATRALARDPDHVARLTGDTVSTSLMLAVVAFGVELIVLVWLPLTALDRILLLILSSQMFAGALNITWAYAGIERLRIPAVASLLGSIVRAGVVFVFLHGPTDIMIAAIGSALSAFVTGIVQITGFRRMFPFHFHFNGPTAWYLIRRSLPLASSGLLIQIYYTMGPLVLGYAKGDRAVAYYSAANRIAALFGTFTGFYIESLFPVVSRLYHQERDHIRPFLIVMLRVAVFIALPIAIGITIFAPTVVRIVYGSAYGQANSVLVILIWSWLVVFLSSHYGNVLIACDGEKSYATGVALGALVAIIANLVLIPWQGVVGAAYANLVSEIVVWAFMVYSMHHQIGFYFIPVWYLIRVVFNGGLMGGVALFLQPSLGVWMTIAISVIFYSLLSFVTKTLPSLKGIQVVKTLTEEHQ